MVDRKVSGLNDLKRRLSASIEESSAPQRKRPAISKDGQVAKVAGRVISVEVEDFMCHRHLKVDFDYKNKNCCYIGGPNGSGKSSLFAALNIGLGGRGSSNDRGNSLAVYIRNGQPRAKIRIILTNEGWGAHPDFGEAVVIERIIHASYSSYRLKSIAHMDYGRDEKLRSDKKRDIDQLLVRYGIQVENPVFWMSQSRCREFLQQMKPSKLYEIFVHAAELEVTTKRYGGAKTSLDQLHNDLVEIQSLIRGKRRSIAAIRIRQKHMESLEKSKARLDELQWLKLWVAVRDADAEVVKHENHVKTVKDKKDALVILRAKNENDRISKNKRLEDIYKEIESLSIASGDLRRKLAEKEATKRDCKNRYFEAGRTVVALQGEVKEFECQIAEFSKQITITKQKAKNGSSSDVSELQAALENSDRSLNALQEERKESSESRIGYENRLKEVTLRSRNFQSELQGANETIKRLREERDRARVATHSEMARFGVEMPDIVAAIEQNAAKFTRKPIGPLGLYVKLLNDRFALAVEVALLNFLFIFMCDNGKDRKVLEGILRQKGLPRMPVFLVSKFLDKPHDTRNSEPPGNCLTVMRAVEVKDPNVFNALIDQSGMERMVLFERDEDARSVMKNNPPPNTGRAYTMNGSLVFPRGHNQAYRFYANTKRSTVQYLRRNNRPQNESFYEGELESASASLESFRRQFTDAQEEARTLNRKANEERLRERKVMEEVNRIQFEKDDIEKKIALAKAVDTSAARIANLESGKAEVEERKEEAQKRVADAKAELGIRKARMAEASAEFRALEEEVQKFESQSQPLEKAKDDLMVELDDLQNKDGEATQVEERLTQKILGLEETLENCRRILERKRGQAEEGMALPIPKDMTNPPDLSVLPSTKAVITEYNQVEAKIKGSQEQLGKSTEPAVSVEEKEKEIQAEVEELKKMILFYEKGCECVKLRMRNHRLMLNSLSLRLCNAYSSLMGIRNYRGTLVVNHQKRTIEISAETNGNASSSNQSSSDFSNSSFGKIRDLRGLSGGERTYTSCCFIMALWSIAESPFRCMDEFDVFLDMNNRKVVMELLVELAVNEYPMYQFVLFTPQGVAELGNNPRVQLYEMHKVRDD